MGTIRHKLRQVTSLYQVQANDSIASVDSVSGNITPAGGGGTLVDDGDHFLTHEVVDANSLFAFDFSGGYWYSKDCDTAKSSGGLLQAGVHGWCGTIYNNPITPTNAVVQLAAGEYAGDTGQVHWSSNNMADHELLTPVNEAYIRYYYWTSTNAVFGAEKKITLNSGNAGDGGIDLGGVGDPNGDGDWRCCPVYDCNTTGEIFYYRQNQGNNLILSDILGHWCYVEIHIKVNTPGQKNGIYELWLDDCGNGTLPHNFVSSPTLRAHHTTVEWQSPSSNLLFSDVWFECWIGPEAGNTPAGNRRYRSIHIKKTPVGLCPTGIVGGTV